MNKTLPLFGVTLLAALAVAGCAGQSNTALPNSSAAVTLHRTQGSAGAAGVLAVSSCKPCATYQNGPASEYFFKGTGKKPYRKVSNGVAAPWVGLVFNGSGDLFVANCTTCLTGQSGVNNVVEFKPNQGTPVVTITNGITYPFDLALDSSGTLYASNLGCYSPSCYGQVSEYPSGYQSGSPSAVLQVKYPLGLALDSHQNLYVANCAVCSSGVKGSDQILVYAPGATTPFRTISTGVNEPVALAIDSADDLYVANCLNCGLGAAAYVSGPDSVTEYAYGGYSPVRTISYSQIDVPFSLAVDKSDDLFVGNYAVNTVTEYPPGGSTPSRTYSDGVSSPASLAITAKGELYVSNAGNGTVTGYAANSHGQLNKTLSVPYPSSIAVSP